MTQPGFDPTEFQPADMSTPDGRRRGAIAVGLTLFALFLIAAGGIWLISYFVAAERERDLYAWQARMNIVAESRFAAVNGWLEDRFAGLTDLAENASLQIYLTEIRRASGDPNRANTAEAQLDYIFNLLTVAAAREGFNAPAPGPAVRANVRRIGIAGLALIRPDGEIIAATPEMPPLEGALGEAVATATAGARQLIDIHPGPDGKPAIGFMVPIFAVQSDGRASQQIGAVVGLRPVDNDFFDLLLQPGAIEESAETLLVRRQGAVIEYLSPLLDDAPPLTRRFAADTSGLAAAFALETPGGFALRRDYRGKEVLVTGRSFSSTPWSLVHKIDRAEALADSDARRTRLLVGFLLAITVAAAVAAAFWRHGASRRASELAAKYQALAHQYQAQGDFLRLVTDSQPNAVFILETDGRYRFANTAAARLAGSRASDMTGKTVASVLGPQAAKRHAPLCEAALKNGAPVPALHQVINEATGKASTVLVEYIPLAGNNRTPPGILVVERDITAEISERQRRERTLDHLVRALITIVDRRDPFAADHSARVAKVAGTVAEEMGLSRIHIDTAELAGSLMNIGKILVPSDLLTKKGDLSSDERQRVRESLRASAELLDGIEFDGPVVETLRQLQERWDGNGGPHGLQGEDILITARIVAVANAFVARISSRAYRPGAPLDDVLDALLGETGKAFDRRVVAALISHLDNHGGRALWIKSSDTGILN